MHGEYIRDVGIHVYFTVKVCVCVCVQGILIASALPCILITSFLKCIPCVIFCIPSVLLYSHCILPVSRMYPLSVFLLYPTAFFLYPVHASPLYPVCIPSVSRMYPLCVSICIPSVFLLFPLCILPVSRMYLSPLYSYFFLFAFFLHFESKR